MAACDAGVQAGFCLRGMHPYVMCRAVPPAATAVAASCISLLRTALAHWAVVLTLHSNAASCHSMLRTALAPLLVVHTVQSTDSGTQGAG